MKTASNTNFTHVQLVFKSVLYPFHEVARSEFFKNGLEVGELVDAWKADNFASIRFPIANGGESVYFTKENRNHFFMTIEYYKE